MNPEEDNHWLPSRPFQDPLLSQGLGETGGQPLADSPDAFLMDDRGAVSPRMREGCPSPAGKGLAQQALAGLAWCETFVALGMHCFWVLSKSSPLAVDGTPDTALALLPFLVMLAAGLLSAIPRARAALVRLEPAFHWTAAFVLTALLFSVVLSNPLTPLLPLASAIWQWSVGLTFVLLGNLAVHLRTQAAARAWFSAAPFGLVTALALFWWAASLWVASGMTWAVWFWTASLLLHAAMAAAAPRESTAVALRAPRLPALVELLFLLFMMGLLQVRGVFPHAVMGNIEERFPLWLAPFHSVLFLAAAILFMVADRFRARFAAHAAVAVFLLAAPKDLLWPLAVGLGYTLSALFRVTRRQGGPGYALAALVMAGLWLLGLGGFAFAGMAVHFDFYADEVRMLLWGLQGGLVLLLALWLALLWRRRKSPLHPPARVTVPLPGWALCSALFIVLLALAVAPGAALLVRTAWPPMVMAQPPSQPVDAPMGLCHAGYSESDEEYKILDALGVQSLRADFTWAEFQPAPDQWNFACREGFVDAAAKHGKRVIAILNYDNNAVEEDPAGKARAMYIAPPDLPKFLEYVRQVVTRYTGRVDAWEIWNEPDISRFWDGPMEEFYALARQTADTIRIADPSARIIGPACTGPLGALGASAIEGLHATGALADVQHPAGHLYATHPRHYYAEFMKLIGAARRHGHPGSVWITELGAPDGGYYPWCANNDKLAEHVIKAYTIATSLGVDRLVWYCFRDGSAESQAKQPPDSEAFFGLLAPGDHWKPSAHAYSLFSRHCTGSTLRGDLVQVSGGLAARQLRSALYRRGNGPSALVLWFEPALRPWGTARASIDFGGINSPPTVHDIGSGQERVLLDDHLDLSERPVLLTFGSESEPEKLINITVTSSPVDALWLVMAAGAVLASLALCLHRRAAASGTP